MAEKLLTAKKIAALLKTDAEQGRHSDGGNLYLSVRGTGRSWTFMFNQNGKRFELGLGPVRDVTAEEARDEARKLRRALRAGEDIRPAVRRQKAAPKPTFRQWIETWSPSVTAAFKTEAQRRNWDSAFRVHCGSLMDLRVDAIETEHVLRVLQPIWQAKPVAARKVQNQIERALDAAKAKGLREGDNPARRAGHLDHLLGKAPKGSRGHFAALHFDAVPALLERLATESTATSLCLRFTILTAVRGGEARGAEWSEINTKAKTWTIPGLRMKSGREHVVPLSDAAIAILENARKLGDGVQVFPGRSGGVLSDQAVMNLLARSVDDGVEATTHGMRSAFRDWCGDRTTFPRELAEQALAHAIGDATEAAYRRSDAIEKRRLLMQAWADHCTGATKAAKVISLQGRA